MTDEPLRPGHAAVEPLREPPSLVRLSRRRCGVLSPPEPDAYRFEPEIISPTRMSALKLLTLPTGLLLFGIVCALIQLTQPGLFRFLLALFALLSAGAVFHGLFAAYGWAIRLLFLPRYIRLAPGIIQVLTYPPFSRKPTIKSFFIERGCVVVVEGERATQRLAVARKSDHALLNLNYMPYDETFEKRLWASLLSTVPTPPLSEEDLIA